MAFLTTQPQLLADAATNVADIRSAIAAANAAAAGPTTSLAAAAADEISEAIAVLFGSHAQEYQAVIGQATAFHEQFVAALTAAGNAYAAAEAQAATTLNSLTAPLFGGVVAPAAAGGAIAPFAAAALPTSILPANFVALIMQGSGTPIPTVPYMHSVAPYIPGVSALTSLFPLVTPEGLYPLTAVKDLPLTVSVNTGVQILDNALFGPQGLISGAAPFGGNAVNVLGYSQSAIISSLELQNIAAGLTAHPLPSQLAFTLLGNPMNPNGGLFARFPGLQLPSLGLDLYGAMPTHTGYQTTTYTLQYDGYADFPRYPLNLLADLNAFAGIQFVHGNYPDINPSALPPGFNLVQLPTTTGPAGLDQFYMITYPNLPLLEPLRALPVIGNPLADLVQPNLTTLVNLGYGDPHYGYSTSPADVPTPFGIFPSVNPVSLAGDLIAGSQQGFGAFVGDLQAMAPASPAALVNSLTSAFSGGGGGGGTGGFSLPALTAGFSPDAFIDQLQALNTNVTSSITNAAANTYAVLLPTADIANALVTSVPSYDFNLFLDGIEQVIGGDPVGGLTYAFGAPIAANTALYALAGGFELNVLINAVEGII
ncbi:PE-PPE domain-containing protein [Mycobacterium sp. 1423905.2]|uniref:PE-PPE domain-containing protein n=1 Tax=Mycobacterium sp. 1423905.2 TaxID=1856859 RepID=UPI0008017B12|nr:PE-PPE domain-containing protein [Mycobacterium sp. 1423905.2]OBJ47833.1 PE family protein [Mycobacterium sp. 1423905.2]